MKGQEAEVWKYERSRGWNSWKIKKKDEIINGLKSMEDHDQGENKQLKKAYKPHRKQKVCVCLYFS